MYTQILKYKSYRLCKMYIWKWIAHRLKDHTQHITLENCPNAISICKACEWNTNRAKNKIKYYSHTLFFHLIHCVGVFSILKSRGGWFYIKWHIVYGMKMMHKVKSRCKFSTIHKWNMHPTETNDSIIINYC